MSAEYSLETSEHSYMYYRNAVEGHWDPHEIDLEEDRKNLVAMADDVDWTEEEIENSTNVLRSALAMFGAGEESVTEDLAPLAVALEDIEDQMFITTQMYEEAKHADFFDRYWREVINPAEETVGMGVTSPQDETWYPEEYLELFEREEQAMHRLVDENTPENRLKAYAHYHLTVEGILAQTGYWGLSKNFDGTEATDEDLPHLPGLVEGIKRIRGDEARHVGFGMRKVKEAIHEEGVDEEVLHDTLGDIVPLVQKSVMDVWDHVEDPREFPGPGPGRLATYAADRHQGRMKQMLDSDATIPDLQELTALD
jgi:ribonucleoside-diphosphate reductase beta chain